MKKTKKSEKNTKKSSNIVPFKQDLVLKDYPNPEQIKEKEINRVNEHFKKTFEDLEKFVDDASLCASETWYRILFYAKQRAIHATSYANFKINNEASTNEVVENFAQFYKENFPELEQKKTDKQLHWNLWLLT